MRSPLAFQFFAFLQVGGLYWLMEDLSQALGVVILFYLVDVYRRQCESDRRRES